MGVSVRPQLGVNTKKTYEGMLAYVFCLPTRCSHESVRTSKTTHLLEIKRVPDVDRRRKITVPRLAARRARVHSMNSVKVLRTLPNQQNPKKHVDFDTFENMRVDQSLRE